MAYLYVDLTPFPHDTNYIELIRGVTEGCAALLQIDANMASSRHGVEEEKTRIERVVAEFRQMATSMAEVLQPYLSREDDLVIKEVANRVVQAIHGVLEGARSSIQSGHESNASATAAKIQAEREQVLPTLEKLLLQHELPETEWTVRWASPQAEGGRADGRAWGTTPPRLEALYQLELPGGRPWSSTMKVGDVKPRVVIPLPRKGRAKPAELDKYNIMEVAVSAVSTRIVVRKALKAGSPGLELLWQANELSIVPRDEDMPPEPFTLEARDAAAVAELRDRVAKEIWSLAHRRMRLVHAKLGGTEVQQLESPAPLASMMIKTIAPYCREIVQRTPVAGELSLKRVVEDRRREEIFIKASELTDLFGSLPPSHRAFFDELGLSGSEPRSPAGQAAPAVAVKEAPLAVGTEVVLEAVVPARGEIPDAAPKPPPTVESSPKVIVELAPDEGKND